MIVNLNGKRKKMLDAESKLRYSRYLMNLLDNYNNFTNIFSLKTKKRMAENFQYSSIINFEEYYRNADNIPTALSDVQILRRGINPINGKYIFILNLAPNQSDFVKKHELWHLVGQGEKEELVQGIDNKKFFTCHGLVRIDEKSRKTLREGTDQELYGYGAALEEGMANLTAVLSTIKEKAAIYRDGKIVGYNQNILKYADEYMETGKINSSLGIYRGYFKIYEDIVRLLTMASRNDYILEHPFSEVLGSDEGIDGMIGSPVNKPYSSFLYSSVNADTSFEKEWDDFWKENKNKGRYFCRYQDLNFKLDQTMDKVRARGTRGLNQDDKERIELFTQNIRAFYLHKLSKLENEGKISENKSRELKERFSKMERGVLEDIDVGYPR